MPKFENAAFNRTVLVSNVCGTPPEDYCMQTGSTRSCRHCDASDPETNHNATYLTDFHTDEEPTWWQSQSMFYGVQYPNSVNLTLHLGKAFEITYVRLKFYTSRPESFAIYKRTDETAPWQPYQYYSASCRKTYGRENKGFIRPGEEERTAVCTDEFSDISPLTGGNVAFSTLEGKPSAYNFDQSPALQEWVTATDLLISLNRLNTFGDEFFKDAKVLRSYFYAISDFSVGGRCKCNGHASECMPNVDGRLACVCQHHTAGMDCQRCGPFYQDRPWARATADSANQCVMCNCSGRADECVFDAEQYRSTGSGGRCVGCRDNTAGPHCEHCRDNFYRPSSLLPCYNCSCNTMGSVSLQCDEEGECACRPSVMGLKCDVCKAGFHSLSPGGCRLCECNEWGSVGVCSAEDGSCHCKPNVEGHSCDRCKPGSFNLQQDNTDGCQACFCFGHSLACAPSSRHVAFNITSDFLEDPDGWVGEFSGQKESPLLWKEGEVYLLPYSEEDAGYYRAPEKFIGNQLLSYGQHLSLSFTAEATELLPRRVTVLLEGSGISVSASLYSEQDLESGPGYTPYNTFTLRLIERDVNPALSPFEFRRMLSNLTALRISNAGGQNYTSQLSGVSLTSAFPIAYPSDSSRGPHAPWVEMCTCPLGFTGQFCELCAPGFTRETPNAGPFSRCVPCNCNQHGTCHPETGLCDCTDFTTGASCERCLDGYYGNPLTGSPNDCLLCPCPDQTTCAQMPETGIVVCTNCPANQRGTRCELCEDGFYGNPLGRDGVVRSCVRCKCNGNVDSNAVGVCDHVTGRCLKCLGHTAGDCCEKCQAGYYGNAVDSTLRPSQKCKPCACSPAGTFGLSNECDPDTGRCLCLNHVTERDCGQCETGYFNLQPGVGCERCNCNPIGSSSPACHPITGQCMCRTGVEGKQCGVCRMGFFGFSSRGCRACNCDPMGSSSMQCHGNGTCPCRQGFVGYKCDKCELNHYLNHVTHQCEECPVCYSLIRDQASKLKAKLQDLERLLSNYDCRSYRQRLYARPHHIRQPQHNELENQVHDHQGEDYLPNALEDFLAIQEAREAFTSQFSQLETSAQTLQLQLRNFAMAVNCSFVVDGGKEDKQGEEGTGASECRALVDTLVVVTDTQVRLQRMTLDLNSLVIPFVLPKGPTQWNALVNESETLVKSHKDMATRIEELAGEALNVSNRTYSMLLSLLGDNSTELQIQDLTEQLSEMQELKENLTLQANETLAAYLSVQEQHADAKAILQNITSTLPELQENVTRITSQQLREADATGPQLKELIQSLDLANRTTNLDILIQSKEQLLNKTREEVEPQLNKTLKTIQEFHQLTALTQGLKEAALSSVIEAKKTESEAFSLRKNLEGIHQEWPVLRTQTKAVLKRESIMEEKTLIEVKKKVRQAERALKPILENATLASNTAAQTMDMANAVAKDAKASVSRGKQMKRASAQLKSAVHASVQQLAEQENTVAQVQSNMHKDEADVSLEVVKDSMESAKIQLEAFTHTLAELLSQLEANAAVGKYDRVLNETAARLLILRASVENPALSGKIQKLRGAAEDQQKQLLQLEQNLQDIREERDSLTDIIQNLPKECPQRGH
ncbi:laminin subunit gamma-3 isoform X2 [Salminus brasiliensis]